MSAAAIGVLLLAPHAEARSNLIGPGTRPEQVASTAPGTPSALVDSNQSDGIAAVVNGDIVTDHELRQRLALYLSTSGAPMTDDAVKKIRPQILEQLEGEKIQIQEAKRKNITISAPEIDKSIDRIVSDNHMTTDALKATLAKSGVDFGTLRSQIAAQILWQKVVSDQFQDRINVTETDVDEEMARIMAGRNKRHYLVAEIFLTVDTPEQDAKVLKNAQEIEAQLQVGAPFQVVARQFSQSPSAATGGDIGWIYDGQLDPELNQALAKMSAGSVSEPIRGTGGYYILSLRERQEPEGTKIPDAPKAAVASDALPLATLLLPIGPKPDERIQQNAMQFAERVSQGATSCAQLSAIHDKVKGSVFMNLGMMKLSDLSEQARDAVAKTEPGHSTQPFASPAGIQIITRCDKAVPKIAVWQPPTRDQVQEQLFDQQVTAFARRYMRDLRRQADVEAR